MHPEPLIKTGSISKKFTSSLRTSMKYAISDIACDSLGINTGSERLRDGEFWAIEDLSFEVHRGECLAGRL